MILNVGVGGGTFISRRLNADVVCDIDYPKVKQENFFRINAEQLPFRDKVFSLTYCHNVLEHVKNPYNVISELKRVSEKVNIHQDKWYSIASYATPEHYYFQLSKLRFYPYPRTKIGILGSKWLRYVCVNFFGNKLHFSNWMNVLNRRYEVII